MKACFRPAMVGHLKGLDLSQMEYLNGSIIRWSILREGTTRKRLMEFR